MTFLKKLAQRTHEVAEAAATAAKEAFSNLAVSEADRDSRYAICKECPHLIQSTTTCTQCGCFMAAKTYLADVECPIGKWHKITLVSNKK
jgi:hypothetical protein